MHKIALAVALAAALVSPVAMAAAATTANGTIKSMDAKACTVTLDNDTGLQVRAQMRFLEAQGRRDEVAVTFTANGAENDATAIAAA